MTIRIYLSVHYTGGKDTINYDLVREHHQTLISMGATEVFSQTMLAPEDNDVTIVVLGNNNEAVNYFIKKAKTILTKHQTCHSFFISVDLNEYIPDKNKFSTTLLQKVEDDGDIAHYAMQFDMNNLDNLYYF